MKRLIYFGLILVALTFVSCDNNTSSSEITKVALRDIGNKLLLSHQDSTSLILPVKEIENRKFELSFQSQLGFNPDSLVLFVQNSIEKANLPKDYLVEVIQCEDKEVAYSYEVKNEKDESIIPCGGRELPRNCYTIQIAFTKSKQDSSYGWLAIVTLAIIGFAFWFYRQKRTSDDNLTEPLCYKIGNYKFDKDQSKLLYVEKEIGLSKKECELLEILCDNLNDVVKRDELSKRVWEDHGVFVGRSLDTYISKLRKKLKEDASIKITNVHGVGYKLEVDKV